MRRPAALALVAALLAGCGSAPVAPAPSSSPPGPTPSSPAASPGPTVEPAPSPPPGTVLFARDVPGRRLPIDRLAPTGTHVTGSWLGRADGEVAVLAVASRAGGAFDRARALWLWRRRPDLGGWVGRALLTYPRRDGVLGIDVWIADVTDDGDDDALVVALTGGSGSCGRWSVLDLAVERTVFTRSLCDARIEPSVAPRGLALSELVFRPGDPHCCPSAERRTLLTYDGQGRWAIVTQEEVPFG